MTKAKPVLAVLLIVGIGCGDGGIPVSRSGANTCTVLVFLDASDVSEKRDGRNVFEMQDGPMRGGVGPPEASERLETLVEIQTARKLTDVVGEGHGLSD